MPATISHAFSKPQTPTPSPRSDLQIVNLIRKADLHLIQCISAKGTTGVQCDHVMRTSRVPCEKNPTRAAAAVRSRHPTPAHAPASNRVKMAGTRCEPRASGPPRSLAAATLQHDTRAPASALADAPASYQACTRTRACVESFTAPAMALVCKNTAGRMARMRAASRADRPLACNCDSREILYRPSLRAGSRAPARRRSRQRLTFSKHFPAFLQRPGPGRLRRWRQAQRVRCTQPGTAYADLRAASIHFSITRSSPTRPAAPRDVCSRGEAVHCIWSECGD